MAWRVTPFRTTRRSACSWATSRSSAKLLGRDHALALELWKTDVYEARMLCAYVDEPERVTPAQMDAQARDFDNWADLRHAVLRAVGAHAARVQEDQAVGQPHAMST